MTDAPSEPVGQRGYDPTCFASLARVEDQHFWFQSRNAVIGRVAQQVTAGLPSGYRVLEVGCGTGVVLRTLEQVCAGGTVLGADLFEEGLRYAQQRSSVPVIRADIGNLPFAPPFAVIGLFDVIEHLPDDVGALRALLPLLGRDGTLLVTVPAHPALWSYFDEAAHHYRRYRPSDLKTALRRAGYRVEYVTQFMAAIAPLMWLQRRMTALTGRRLTGDGCCAHELAASDLRITPVVNGILTRVLKWEAHVVARRGRLPVGTSLLAVARQAGASRV